MVFEGTYRFKGFLDHVLTATPSGQVKGVPYEQGSKAQEWKVTPRKDGKYDLTSVSTGLPTRIVAPHGGETSYTVYADAGTGAVSWDLGDPDDLYETASIMIKAAGQAFTPGNVLDLSQDWRVVLWEVNTGPNQYWTIESTLKRKKEMEWVRLTSHAEIPDNAVESGRAADGSPLYVARAPLITTGYSQPGKASKKYPQGCWYAYRGEERIMNEDFEVLTSEPGATRWVSYPSGGRFDPDKLLDPESKTPGTLAVAIYAAYDPFLPKDKQWLYCVRAKCGDEMTGGTAGPGLECAYLPYKGKEVVHTGPYEVLCEMSLE